MTTENIDSQFLDYLENSNKIRESYVKNFSKVHEVLNKTVELYSSKNFDHKIYNASFYNNDGIYKIRDLKSTRLGQLISFSGTATRTTQVRPELIIGTFVCKMCNSVANSVEQEFKYTEPLVCPNHLCTNRSLWSLEIDESRFSNWQRIHVQENTDEIPPGALPRSLDVIVRDDMVEKVKAGDKVLFTGYLVVIPDVIQLMMPQSKSVPVQQGVSDVAKHRRNMNIKDLNYKLSFMCVNVDYKAAEVVEFTKEELKAIEDIRNTQNLYYKLSQSLFPSIHGHYSIKNAILLLLAGGVSKTTESGVKLRGDINVLLVGDPASILAAANPIKGRYDKRKTLRQNINLSQPIMSRFDLYFVLIDDVDKENDTNIANHVLHNHEMYADFTRQESYFTLEQVKLYLKYVKSMKPKLTDEAHDALVQNYSRIRQDSLINSQNYKMTVRHLESMIRLSEALAKLHCDEEVKIAYVEEAYRLISSSVIELKGEDIEICPVDSTKPSAVINNKDIIRITNSLVYLIKTHDPMSKENLIECYLEQVEGTIETEEGFFAERDMAERVIEYLILHEGVLFLSDDLVYIHPNYDV
ncbi:DNA replication licensing factor MCM6, partial [Nosema bombycis CQ1]